MIRGRAFGKSRHSRPLKFRNKFASTGVRQIANRVIAGPVISNGITSIEKDEKARMMRRYGQMANAGVLKQMQELGIIPDSYGVDMSEFDTGNIALPHGVTSLDKAAEQADVMRQIQRFNAGILDEEHSAQKTLMDIANKRKKAELRTKLIQWLAETDELDEVPAEFTEEVKAYHLKKDREQHQAEGTSYAAYQARLNAKKAQKDAEEQAKRNQQGYWYNASSRAFNNIGMPRSMSSGQQFADRPKIEEKAVPLRYAEYNEYPDLQEFFGDGAIGGWRAPRLHRLVRPLKPFIIEGTPEEIVEEQKQTLDDRRDAFKEEETKQRGVAPEKDKVEAAIPKTAEPIMLPVMNIPSIKLIPHPFIFPKKKYWVKKGISGRK